MRQSSLFNFLWNIIKPYRFYYGLMLVPPILGSFYEFANNYALKLVVDAFELGSPTLSDLTFPIVLFIAGQILLDVLWRIGDFAEWRSEPYVRQAILNKSYDYVQHNPYGYFQDTPTGIITSKIKGILDGYDNFWASMHHDFTPKLANTIISIAVLAIVSIKICLIVALWTLLFLAIMYPLTRKLDSLSFKNAQARHNIFGLIADNITNIFNIFSFATRKVEQKRLDKLITREFIPANLKVYYFSFWTSLIGAILYWMILISLFIYMIKLRQAEEVTTGDLVFVMGISLKLMSDLWHLVQKLQDFMKNIGDFKNAYEILKTPHEAQPRPNTELIISRGKIRFEHIYFSYETEKPIFIDLEMEIKAGEKVGLVGVTGAGKSTIISLLLKNFKPKSGQILIDGHDIAHFSDDEIRRHISYIPQDIMLFHRSILDNIRYGNEESSDEDVFIAARRANIHDFIMTLPDQYGTLVGERGIKLSGGQRQRIAIARALLKQAPILVLDEATSSLDAETERLIQASLDAMLEDRKITVIAIAHRLSTLKHMDRIIVLDRGRILEEGTHAQLIASDTLYHKLWELQKI